MNLFFKIERSQMNLHTRTYIYLYVILNCIMTIYTNQIILVMGSCDVIQYIPFKTILKLNIVNRSFAIFFQQI